MDCVFCKISKKELPADIVYEDDKALVFLDIAPVNPGHTLVVSKEHHKTLLETPHDVACHLMSIVHKVAPAIINAVNADGFNLGVNNGAVAGQVVWHTHYHIIPRFKNDGLVPWPNKKSSPAEMKKIADKIREQTKNIVSSR